MTMLFCFGGLRYKLPSHKELGDADRADLAMAVRRAGGTSAVSDYVGVRPAKYYVREPLADLCYT